MKRSVRGAVGAGALLVCSLGAISPGAADAPKPTDLQADVAAGEAGEHVTANDVEKGAETNVDNGQVQNVDSKDNSQSGETANSGDSGAVATHDSSGSSGDPSGPDGDSSGPSGKSSGSSGDSSGSTRGSSGGSGSN